MARFAIGDLFIDLEVPAHLQAAYSDTGVLMLEDADDPIYLIEASAFTVTPQDPSERTACVKFNRQRARDAGKHLVEVSPEHVYWQESASYADEQDEPMAGLHWRVGYGNRAPLITLSYRAADADQLDRRALATTVDAMVRSVRRTHEELAPVDGPAIVRDLAASQAPWLESKRMRLAERFEDAPTLAALDELWKQLVDDEPEESEINAVINEVGVALGDELVKSRHAFEWCVVTDAFGTALSVVALRDTAKVVVDPFNFVAKRWDSREPTFLVDGVEGMLSHVDRISW